MLLEAMYVISYTSMNLKWSYHLETLKSETNHQIFRLCGLTNLMDDLKKKQ